LGASRAVRVAASYETVAAMTTLAAFRSSNAAELTVAGSSASLKVAVTTALALTLVAPAAGIVLTTVGGVVSPPPEVTKTRSTQ
jgi:hypothetical protein